MTLLEKMLGSIYKNLNFGQWLSIFYHPEFYTLHYPVPTPSFAVISNCGWVENPAAAEVAGNPDISTSILKSTIQVMQDALAIYGPTSVCSSYAQVCGGSTNGGGACRVVSIYNDPTVNGATTKYCGFTVARSGL